MKIYHTATQEDYIALMVELEEQGYKWQFSSLKPSEFNSVFNVYQSDTCIFVEDEKSISFGNIYWSKGEYPNTPIIEYKAPSKQDNNNPNHYKFGDIQSMDFVDAVIKYGEFTPEQAPYLHNIIKYVTRAPRKNGVEDLKKAQWYLDRLIKITEEID